MANFDFREWIREQDGNYQTDFRDPNRYRLLTDYATAEINFYEVGQGPEVVEFRIVNKIDEQVKFYLHFQLNNISHAMKLFGELVQTLVSLESEQTVNVLLCCSTGLTTSYFANQLNNTAKTLNLDYHFEATGLSKIYQSSDRFSVIMLAPQIGYEEEKIRKVLRNKLVFTMPATIFGQYNAPDAIDLLRQKMTDFRKKNSKKQKEPHVEFTNNYRIMVITVIANAIDSRLRCCFFDRGNADKPCEIIKRDLSLKDIEDAIDTCALDANGRPLVDAIGIALRGVVYDRQLEFPIRKNNGTTTYIQIVDELEKRYPDIKFVLVNNANAASAAIYHQHDEEFNNNYENLVFITQPKGFSVGGAGAIVNGQLVCGAHNSAGELRYCIGHFNYKDPLNFNPYSPQAMLQVITYEALTYVTTFDPEAIFIHCELLPDMEPIKQALLEYIPENHVPDLIPINNYRELVVWGTMIITAQEMEKNA